MCIQGKEETAKYWINEMTGAPGTVENVEAMWNDCTRNAFGNNGADVHEAKKLVGVAAKLYASKMGQLLVEAFLGTTPRSFATDKFNIEYRRHRGPGINEHLLIFTTR